MITLLADLFKIRNSCLCFTFCIITGKYGKIVKTHALPLFYSTLFNDSTILILFSLKYMTALTKNEKPIVIRKL